jgi:NADPH:quinone reductase
VDVVVDPVGGSSFEALFRSLAKDGRHLIIGFAGGSIPALPANLPLLKSAALVGVDIRHFHASRPEDARLARSALLEQVASGVLAGPQIVTFSMEQAREALGAAPRRDKAGKVVVLVRRA